MPEVEFANLNPRQRYYYAHKNDPGFLERIRKSTREYRQRNLETLRLKKREYYYKKKYGLTLDST